MSDVPVCRKCDRPHWRFVACDQAGAYQADRDLKQRRRVEAYPVKSVPDGYRLPAAGLSAHPARTVPDGFKPHGVSTPKGFRPWRGTTNDVGPEAA